MTTRTTTLALGMVMVALGCGPDVILHDDGGGSDDGSTTDDADTSTGNADGTTGEPVTIPGEGPYGAGTRLLPVVERTEDGTAQLVHWFDNELGIDCEFVRDSVGTTRCLPVEVPGVWVGYSTEDCTEPLLGVASCGGMPTHVRAVVPGAADCSEGARQQAYLRGAPIGSGSIQRLSMPGSCLGSDDAAERYALTPIADEEFAAATVVLETRGSATVRAFVTDDGAFERHGLVDPRTGTACRVDDDYTSSEDALACRLADPFFMSVVDETCSMTFAAIPDDGTCEPSAVQAYTAGLDEWTLLGEPYAGPLYESTGEGTCEPRERLFDPYSYRPVGETVPAVASPSFARVVADDAGRVRRIVLAGADETLALPGVFRPYDARWFDTLLDQECEATPDDEGRSRCFPRPLVNTAKLDAWGDATCSEIPLHVTVEADEPFARITRVTYDDCGSPVVESVQNVVGLWDGPIYGPGGGEDCVPQEPSEIATAFQLGNYVPLDDAPVLELGTD